MATTQRIVLELGKMALLYRQQMSPQELQVLAPSWAELCLDLSDNDFIAACKAHLRSSKFFPCPADILTAAESLWSTQPALEALPPAVDNDPDEHRRSAISSSMIIQAMRNPEAKQFFEMDNWQDKDALARKILGDKYPEPGSVRPNGATVTVGDIFSGVGPRQ